MKTSVSKLMLAGLMAITALTGCSSAGSSGETTSADTQVQTEAQQEAAPAEENAQEESAAEAAVPMKTITDQSGTEVQIPQNVHRVVISSIFPIPSVYCLFREGADEVVGMHPQAMAAAKESFLGEVYPEILQADTSFAQGGEINTESILALDPDIVIYSAANADERAMYENAGLTPVAFSPSIAGFDCVETYASWNDLLGQIFDDSEWADLISKDARALAEKVKAVTSTIPEEEKPSVLILFNYDGTSIKAAGSNSFGQYWIEQGGGINAAAELKGHADVNIEQIYEWDPDIILLSNFVEMSPEEFMNDTSMDWSSVKAVSEGKVYKFPLGMYRWYPASSDSALSLEWVAKTLQPEYMKDFDLDADVKEYYMNNYTIELSDEDLARIYGNK
ncbi:MAG: ABC transporter substrate-binding protein [Oscillospiraceae bacterium]|nr:ABC transporter substrate-binding protein [Oscillospiraceae bacterium]